MLASLIPHGSNALMLDIDHGTYPYVTSSPTGTGGAVSGLGLWFREIKEVIGVVKAYTTRVGAGPFPSEALNDDGDALQRIGHEYGVTTGRRRRCGWLDLVVLKYSCTVNGYTSLNLTKLDILDHFQTIRVAVAYTRPDGRAIESFPADLRLLEDCNIVYEDLPGWKGKGTVAGVRSWDGLPQEARSYVEFIEKRVGVSVRFIGTGVDREDMIVR
ncbi:MAG: hypothetical protein Q9221_008923 [Calogaya cf. arnoldii]